MTKHREEQLAADQLINCPEEGFHTDKDGTSAEGVDYNDPNEEERKQELNLDQKFLKTVLEHVRHFVSMAGKPAWQIAALDCVTTCLDLLGSTQG